MSGRHAADRPAKWSEIALQAPRRRADRPPGHPATSRPTGRPPATSRPSARPPATSGPTGRPPATSGPTGRPPGDEPTDRQAPGDERTDRQATRRRADRPAGHATARPAGSGAPGDEADRAPGDERPRRGRPSRWSGSRQAPSGPLPPRFAGRPARRGQGFPRSHGPTERKVTREWLTGRYPRPRMSGANSYDRVDWLHLGSPNLRW